MKLTQAIQLIETAVQPLEGVWADIGAGTGLFTQALQTVLESGKIYALDKNPHALWKLEATRTVALEIVEGDFNRSLPLPKVDGIIMANALHYATAPAKVLQNILQHLKPDGVFILIEYDTTRPNPPWVPYPIPAIEFSQLAIQVGLTEPIEINRAPSRYGHNEIYSVYCRLSS